MDRAWEFCGAMSVSVLHPYSIILRVVQLKVQTWKGTAFEKLPGKFGLWHCSHPLSFWLGFKVLAWIRLRGRDFFGLWIVYMISGVCINSCAIFLQSPLFPLQSQDTQVLLTQLPSFLHLLWGSYYLSFDVWRWTIFTTILWYCLSIPGLYRLFPPSGELSIRHLYFAVWTHLYNLSLQVTSFRRSLLTFQSVLDIFLEQCLHVCNGRPSNWGCNYSVTVLPW